jgi:hypothetical protein
MPAFVEKGLSQVPLFLYYHWSNLNATPPDPSASVEKGFQLFFRPLLSPAILTGIGGTS